MTTETSNVDCSDSTASLPVDTVFDILFTRQRRDALSYLSRHVGAVSIDDLVADIALRDGEATPERLETIATEFMHAHLPKLVDSAVVRYDPATRTIERCAVASDLDPYLDLAADGRLPRSN